MPRSDNADYEALLAEEGQYAWRLIVRILGNDGHDAADCFQQAFVELAARRNRAGDVRDAGALLRRIASARAIDCVRRRIRDRKRTQYTDESQLVSDSNVEPDGRAEASELLEDLRVALAELPDQQAAAFVLVQIENLPRDQAAMAINVSVNHLGVLLHRARTALRERLASHKPIREARP